MRNKITRRKRPDLLPPVLHPVAKEKWEDQGQENLIQVWMSRDFTVQIYKMPKYTEGHDVRFPRERLCITHAGISTAMKAYRIPFHILMKLKLQCGRGGQWALEVYPTLDHGVSVPEARHLYIFYEKPEFL